MDRVSASRGLYYTDTHEPKSSTNFSTATNRLTVASSIHAAAANQTCFARYMPAFDAENRIVTAKEGATIRAGSQVSSKNHNSGIDTLMYATIR